MRYKAESVFQWPFRLIPLAISRNFLVLLHFRYVSFLLKKFQEQHEPKNTRCIFNASKWNLTFLSPFIHANSHDTKMKSAKELRTWYRKCVMLSTIWCVCAEKSVCISTMNLIWPHALGHSVSLWIFHSSTVSLISLTYWMYVAEVWFA